MSKRRRVVSPRIVLPHGFGLWFFIVLLVLSAISGAFVAGVFLAREEAKPVEAVVVALTQERDVLVEQLAAVKQEQIVLDRTLQIEREANSTAREGLKAAQDERLTLEKEASFLKRLIREGGGGILKVQDVALAPGEEEGLFAYSFTVSQLISEFSESAGTVALKLAGKLDGEEVTLGLDKLAGSKPTSHKMHFKHFQHFEGTIQVPEDMEPETLVIELKPTTKKLIPVTDTFPWGSAD